MKILIKQFIIEQKLFYRNPVSVFWTYLFPLFIMLIIGWFFNEQDRQENKNIIIIDNAGSSLSQKLTANINKNFIVTAIDTDKKEEILQSYTQNKYPKKQLENNNKKKANITKIPILIIEKEQNNISIKIYSAKNYSKNNINAIYQIVSNINKQENNNYSQINIELMEYKKENELKYSDFLAPGMIAMSIMSTCIFGVGISLTSYREKGNLRRLSLTPIKKWTFIFAHIIHRYVVILIQSIILLANAYIFFSLKIKGDFISLIVILTIGLLTFISIGFIVASRTNKVESANALSNILFYPLLLLGSVYFSIDKIPEILHPIAKLTPLLHLTEALRKVINNGIPFYELSHNILPMLAITILCFFISVKIFRWE